MEPLQLSFQSTLPVWGATAMDEALDPAKLFQSTLPVWGATSRNRAIGCHLIVSIHAPRVGSDVPSPASLSSPVSFNPRSPCGERPPKSIEATAPM